MEIFFQKEATFFTQSVPEPHSKVHYNINKVIQAYNEHS